MTANEKELKIQKIMVRAIKIATKSAEEANLFTVVVDALERDIVLSILAVKIFDELIKFDQLAK